MNSITKYLTLTLVLSLGACAQRPGNNDAYDGFSDRCSVEFISDYNSLVYSAKMVYTESSLYSYESEVDAFGKKYSGVVCRAVRREGYSSNSDAEFIDVDSEVKRIKSVIANVKSKF